MGGRRRHLLPVLVLLAAALPARAQEGIRYDRPAPAAAPVLTRPPALVRFVPARYPEAAQAAGVEADVLLQVDLDAAGAVSAVAVTKGAGRGFDEAAVEAVRAFAFQPGEVDGKPAPVRIEYVYHFRLEKVPVETRSAAADAAAEPAVKGRVRERGTRLPIPGAALSVDGVPGEVRTDAKGAFSIAGLEPGKHVLRVVAAGFRTATTPVEVRPGTVAELTFHLAPEAEDAYQTIVHGAREEEVVARYTVTKREMTTVPGTFGDPLRVIQNLPGVARSPYVLGLLLVRGSYPGDSGVYLDGIRIPILYHFMGGPSVLNPDFLSRIDFYPGNFSARFGEATGGIVDVETKSALPETWHGTADLNLLYAGAFTDIPLSKKVSLKLGLRRSYYDAIIPLALKAAGRKGTTVVPVYWDYQARVDADLGNDDRVHVFAFGSDDSLALATSDAGTRGQVDLSSRTGFHRITAGHLWHATKGLENRLSPWLGLDVTTIDFGEGYVDTKVWAGGLRDELSWRPHPTLELRPGVDLAVQRFQYAFNRPPLKDFRIPGADLGSGGLGGTVDTSGDLVEVTGGITAVSFAAYLEAVWQPWRFLTVIPGVRAQSHFYLGRSRFRADPRLTVRADVGWGLTLKAGAGLFSQLPASTRLDPNYGNPDLKMEWAEQYSLGVERDFPGILKVDLQGFFIRRHDRAVRTSAFSGTRPLLYANDGRGRAYGLELLLRHDPSKWFYAWIAYTLSRSEDASGPGKPYTASRWDQAHILTAVASVRLPRGWEVGARFRLVSGNPTTPVLDSTFVADAGRYVPLQGERDSSRMPMFHQLDLRAEKTWTFERWMFSMYLDVQNLYNAVNPEFRIRDYRYKASFDIRGITFLPTFGFKGQF